MRESRWKLILSGLLVTLLISVCSALLGAALGFGLCLIRRGKNRVLSGAAAAFIRLVQGIPMVVLLMLLYYIVFASADVSGVLVGILGFAIHFGVHVSEMMRTGIDAVGYIAIQYLTKASDIIRRRTYEAFFPLIATAVIYFLLAWGLTLLLGRIETGVDPKRRGAAPPDETVIRIEHLKKAYPNVTPLRDVNAEIRAGDVVTIIGPSGAGKSTLLRCLNRLETPTAGEITVLGRRTDKKAKLGALRQKMGMVFQSFNLFPHLTVIENVMLAPVKLKRLSRQEAFENALRLLGSVGLAEEAMSYPDELSGGQKQRVAIARARGRAGHRPL